MNSVSVGSVFDRARFFLNDQNIQLYSNAVLAEAFRTAYDDLKEECYNNSLRFVGEVSVALDIDEGMTDIGGDTGPALPINLVVPITLWERPANTDVNYVRMTGVRNLPKTEVIINYLQYWSFNKQIIEFLGANQDQQVKIDYLGDTFGIIRNPEDRLNLFNAKTFLSYRTAALASQFQGENESRADKLNGNARVALDNFLNTDIKNQQNMPVRRRPFRAAWKLFGRSNWY
jgi:hypothetical protein